MKILGIGNTSKVYEYGAERVWQGSKEGFVGKG